MTAANGAEQYYGLSSDDTIRNETAEQASGIDQQLIEVQEYTLLLYICSSSATLIEHTLQYSHHCPCKQHMLLNYLGMVGPPLL